MNELHRRHAAMSSSLAGLQTHMAEEMFRRFAQCQWLEKRILSLENTLHREALRAARIDEVEIATNRRLNSIQFELELFCEAYYLVAWRATQCLATLPGFKNFCVKGIRDVRNRLIEHPDRSGGVYEWSTSYVSGIGLKLKPMPRISGQPAHVDKGLWNNVMSMYIEVLARASAMG